MQEVCQRMVNIKEKQLECEKILSYSQNIPLESIDLTNHLKTWRHNKARFLELFQNQTTLKIASDVNIFGDGTAESKFQTFVEEAMSYIACSDPTCVDNDFFTFITSNFSQFFDNIVTFSTRKEVKSGSKLTKAFKNYIHNEEILRKVQDIASRYIQEKKITGNLYLSIEPADYLLMSETNADWDSCHTLDGDYRSGSLAYMMDEVTVIAYLASEEKENLRASPPDLFHHNKKWRMLIHIHPRDNVIYYNRQYPFVNEILLNKVHTLMKTVFKHLDPKIYETGFKKLPLKNDPDFCLPYNHFVVDNHVINTKEVIPDNPLLYSDLKLSHKYSPVFAIKRNLRYGISRSEMVNAMFMRIGEKRVPCIIRGCTYDLSDSEFCVCPTCQRKYIDYKICNVCGCRIYDEDTYFEDRYGDIYCEDCYVKEHGDEEENY